MRIQFRDCPPLIIDLDDTVIANQWQALVKQNYDRNPRPIFRDQQRYTPALLEKLALRANHLLGWNWDLKDLSLGRTVVLHKDIEKFLAGGYGQISAELDELMHEIHYCLHAIESGSQRDTWLQIEWYNDDGFVIPPDEYPGKIQLDFGDIRLQNPYVGHHPLFVYQQQDYHNISQTCRFHDLARPGINIVIKQEVWQNEFPWNDYFDWFMQHGRDFVQTHSLLDLIKYTGHPIVGRVRNLKDLEICVQTPILEFDRIIWD